MGSGEQKHDPGGLRQGQSQKRCPEIHPFLHDFVTVLIEEKLKHSNKCSLFGIANIRNTNEVIADVKFCTGFVNVTKPYKLVEKYDNINDLTMFVSKICD